MCLHSDTITVYVGDGMYLVRCKNCKHSYVIENKE